MIASDPYGEVICRALSIVRRAWPTRGRSFCCSKDDCNKDDCLTRYAIVVSIITVLMFDNWTLHR